MWTWNVIGLPGAHGASSRTTYALCAASLSSSVCSHSSASLSARSSARSRHRTYIALRVPMARLVPPLSARASAAQRPSRSSHRPRSARRASQRSHPLPQQCEPMTHRRVRCVQESLADVPSLLGARLCLYRRPSWTHKRPYPLGPLSRATRRPALVRTDPRFSRLFLSCLLSTR